MRLERKILIAFVAGSAAGALARIDGATWLQPPLIALEPIGTIFIRLITMVVIPLVIASVFVGVASLGGARALGRLGGKTLGYFFGTTLAAATVGLIVATLARVGDHGELAGAGVAGTVLSTPPSVVQTLIDLVPQNPFASAAQGGGQLLPLIIAVCIFAAATSTLESDGSRAVVRFFEGVNEISMVVIGWLMRLAPVAVFALIAATVARSGIGLLDRLAYFALIVVAALAVHSALILLPALVVGARQRISYFMRSVSDALLLAFSTAASNVALPASMTAARDRLGVPEDIVNFVLPAGASLNKNGSAAYKAVAVLFIAHLYGMQPTGGALVTIVLVSSVAAFAGAGVPGSSLVTTLIVLDAIGLGSRAAAGIALVASVDRPLDMCRSAVNTFSNLVGATWLARSEAAETELDVVVNVVEQVDVPATLPVDS
ncbi:MAG TPA: dicarboxylate/amino acid:cation symporter [Gemmatimonadaceae bacterium]|nr:dicarboxylate/amino acid:cation symporter [Gemmatimonadaceae bacterium]